MGILFYLIALLGIAASSSKNCLYQTGIRHRTCSDVKGFVDVGGSCYSPIFVSGDLKLAREACQVLHPLAELASTRCEVENHLLANLAIRSLGKKCFNNTKDQNLNQAWIGLKNGKAEGWPNGINFEYRNWMKSHDEGFPFWYHPLPSSETEHEKKEATTMLITKEAGHDLGTWKDMEPNSMMCGAICEVLVESSGKSCGLDVCGESLPSCEISSTGDGCVEKVMAKENQECDLKTIKYENCEEVPGFVNVGGSCYAAIKTDSNYEGAREICQKLHPKADLASIRCEVENQLVADMAESYLKNRCTGYSWDFIYLHDAWIGLNDVMPTTNGTWLNGVTSTYRKWSNGEPNNGLGARPEAATAMHVIDGSKNARWNDMHVNDKMCGAICEVIVKTSGRICLQDACGNPTFVWLY